MAQKEVKNRISSVKNIQKITRAMEMVAAARLRRAEQRIEALRPYASAILRMTRPAAEAEGDGRSMAWYASGRRGTSSLQFRGLDVVGSYTGFTDRPAYGDARDIAADLMTAYVDGQVDKVEIIYNHYISPLTQRVTRETLLPLQQATILEAEEDEEEDGDHPAHSALVEYEPDPEEILRRLIPAYVEISIFRALLESTASEHGARMTAMRNASENAGDIIKDLTLQMNRERQAEITQEILEVVSGAEGLR